MKRPYRYFNLFLKLLIAPFLLCIMLITFGFKFIWIAFHRTILFVVYGGEWINYKPKDFNTIQEIYEELKSQRK